LLTKANDRKIKGEEMDAAELTTLMQDCANAAIEYAQNEFDLGLTLDYSSIYMVERMMIDLHQQIVLSNDDPINPETVVGLSNMFGAYLGELFKAQMGGQWVIDESDPEAPAIVLAFKDREYPFPGRVFHRILGGEGNSLSAYFNTVFNDCVANLEPGQYVDNRDFRIKACRARIITE